MNSEQMRCQQCAIRHKAVCGALSDEEIVRLNQMAHQREFSPGQMIFADGEPTAFLANVISGSVKLSKMMPDGRQQIVGLLFPPDFLGRAYSEHNPYFAEAASPVRLCMFSRDSFQELLNTFPGLAQRLFEHTLSELDASREWMLLLGRKTAAEKVASFLLMVAERSRIVNCSEHAEYDRAAFSLPLSRADIADYLGLTIETVSRQMTRLKSDGLVELSGSRNVAVPSIPELRLAAQSQEPA